jgi:hypothetical protein
MGVRDIVVLIVVALFMGALGALVYYVNKPVPKDTGTGGKE